MHHCVREWETREGPQDITLHSQDATQTEFLGEPERNNVVWMEEGGDI